PNRLTSPNLHEIKNWPEYNPVRSVARGHKDMGMKKIALILGAAVLLVSLLLGIHILFEISRESSSIEVLAPPRDTSQQERVLREKLNYYEKNVNDLKELATLIVGISTLYGLVLGIGAYMDVNDAKSRASEIITRLGEQETQTLGRVQSYETDFKTNLNKE